MKIVVIGDIHGRNCWKSIVQQNQDADKFVFIGDYFDSFHISGTEQLHNFKEIVNFKKDNLDKVVLLLGNHEFHYMSGCIGAYAGFQMNLYPDFKFALNEVLKEELVQVVYRLDNYLFSHAGISNTWFESNIVSHEVLDNEIESINDLFYYQPNKFNFIYSPYDFENEGDSKENGPFWIRPKSLAGDALAGYTQIVGHTHYKEIRHLISRSNDYIWFVDTLPHQYMVIDNNNIQKRAL
jgi:predicted MPP superfamily phosphohydrolase